MNNKIFIDISIFIESFKGNPIAKEILEKSIDKFDICINGIVFSEVIFRLISLESGKSALTLKSQKEMSPVINKIKDYSELLLIFDVLGENKNILEMSLRLMKKYNLLTNDAIILATCKYYSIDKLASLDKDFEDVTQSEGIKLIQNVSDIE
ncbi:type II toxin-antitoxin system VapC family toxin [Persephonella sp. KM09-Lau-8]|uniref:type II toxin-antitoxin system VapC family toxin n=1 Tax=Persephonella sp. KM09-Lau-8 TaxID=1158345 RepID=UPI0004972EF9|nr:type II toxin-antitoxin system VapC family toxin [Persephonella sp. KM09-Lau-8]